MSSEPSEPSDASPLGPSRSPDRRAFVKAFCAAVAVGTGGLSMLRARAEAGEGVAGSSADRGVVVASTTAQVAAFLPSAIARPVRREIQIPSTDRYRATVTSAPIFLIRTGESHGEVRALSAVCPHAGCVVSYQAAGRRFACPCHQAHFDAAGERIDGPSPRGLDPLELQISESRVVLAFRQYRLNRADRVDA